MNKRISRFAIVLASIAATGLVSVPAVGASESGAENAVKRVVGPVMWISCHRYKKRGTRVYYRCSGNTSDYYALRAKVLQTGRYRYRVLSAIL